VAAPAGAAPGALATALCVNLTSTRFLPGRGDANRGHVLDRELRAVGGHDRVELVAGADGDGNLVFAGGIGRAATEFLARGHVFVDDREVLADRGVRPDDGSVERCGIRCDGRRYDAEHQRTCRRDRCGAANKDAPTFRSWLIFFSKVSLRQSARATPTVRTRSRPRRGGLSVPAERESSKNPTTQVGNGNPVHPFLDPAFTKKV
jgi:hypothetical protein